MKYDEPQKITALGVVIFSFLSLLICFGIIALIDILAAFLVLKTPLPESVLKIGNVLGCGAGIITSTAMLTVKGRMKGILSAGIIAACIIMIKIIGNNLMELNGYFNWNGFAGIIFTVVFALIGGVLGASLKGR